jgi:hypothetical protein
VVSLGLYIELIIDASEIIAKCEVHGLASLISRLPRVEAEVYFPALIAIYASLHSVNEQQTYLRSQEHSGAWVLWALRAAAKLSSYITLEEIYNTFR